MPFLFLMFIIQEVVLRPGLSRTSILPCNTSSKRKSAVELLQESKAFYVKSETVLDRQQQLKHTGHLQVTSSAVDTVFLRGPRTRSDSESRYIHQHVLVLSPSAPPAPVPRTPAPTPAPPPALPPKSPRLVSAAQRRSGSHHSTGSDQLQTKLRRLLNADSKENVFLGDSWDDEDAKTVAGDERPFMRSNSCPRSSPVTCSVHHKSLPDLHAGPQPTSPPSSTDTSDSRSVRSKRHSGQCGCVPCCSSRHCRRSLGSAMSTLSSSVHTQKSRRHGSSNSSPGARSQRVVFTSLGTGSPEAIHTSKNGPQSPDSGRAGPSPGECIEVELAPERHSVGRTIDSANERMAADMSSSFSDSGAEDITSPIPLRVVNRTYIPERRRPILRSKSDISHRYSRGSPHSAQRSVPSEPQTSEQLERFFEQLGLETSDFRSLSAPLSGSSSPVFFDSVSSLDSAVAWGPESGGTSGNMQRPAEQLSIVERNARIIKWLCNCRKAQLASHSPS
ncbi:uncharacterized protein [Anabrus simplex]|uniref:uncharacterized protein n=1 Tax=Anabrus simplex TaxID=316456 RepID=UPI0035A2B4BB